MTILLFGGAGLLGRAIQAESLEPILAPSHNDLDICDLPRVRQAIGDLRPSKIINAAAYTNVDRAEVEPRKAFYLNAEAAELIAIEAHDANVPLVHISSDYIFGAIDSPSAHLDYEPAHPTNAYGWSKAFGERYVRTEYPGAAILRTAGLYSAATGLGIIKNTFERAKNQNIVVIPQVFCPTAVEDVAKAVLLVGPGTWNFAGTAVSRYNLAAFITASVNPSALVILALAIRGLAPRPTNSALDSSAFFQAYGLRARPWSQGVSEALRVLAQ